MPSLSATRRTGWPLTNVPFVELRSTKHHLVVFHPQFRMVPGHARVHQPKVAVRAPAEQRHRRDQIVRVLVAAG